VRDFASLWHRTLIWNSIVLYKQHAVQHQEPSSFIASLQATPPRALLITTEVQLLYLVEIEQEGGRQRLDLVEGQVDDA
jgi:hypothetical protein